MNRAPVVARAGDVRENILGIMMLKDIRNVPLLDEGGRLVGIEVLSEIAPSRVHENRVVLLAGGRGRRLRPLTDERPKPLIHVGNRPILETILANLGSQGFRTIYLSVDYKAEMVKDHFGDGSRWGVNIAYLHEESPLGTAGPLGLLPEAPRLPVLVMNGDLLTKVNFQQLLDFHAEHRARATMCVRECNIRIPFGVVTIDRQRLTSIEEKPEQRFLVNAGIYVLEPEVVAGIPRDIYLDMPDLFRRLIAENVETAVFPIREYWLDVGRPGDLEQAQSDYKKVFK
jgi:NDP-sugar pyrophosphorylase family protein